MQTGMWCSYLVAKFEAISDSLQCNRVRTNTSIPVGARVNTINEWADIRNAEVGSFLSFVSADKSDAMDPCRDCPATRRRV